MSQSTLFQSCRDGGWLPGYYQYFSGSKCVAQGHNTAEVGIETPTSHPESETLPLGHGAPLRICQWAIKYVGFLKNVIGVLPSLW